MKKFICILTVSLLLIATALSAAACAKTPEETPAEIIARWETTYSAGDFGIRSKTNPFVEFTLSTDETIRIELYPNVAPISVNNFITYVEEGFYEGTAFHRIIQNQMIQGGGYEIDKDDHYVHKAATHDAIKGEFRNNGIPNNLSHTRGVISMARTNEKDSATSQFFICAATVSSWDGEYAAFGRVIDKESMAVVSRLEKISTGSEALYDGERGSTAANVPVSRITIKKAQLVWDK